MTIAWYLAVSAIVFAIGAVGVITRRNPLVVLLCLELMLNGGNLALIAYGRQLGDVTGQLIVFFVMAVAAAEAAVGLALFIAAYRLRHTIDINRLNLMKW